MSGIKTKVCNKKKELHEPLWKGPEKDGITQSMISQWLECKERFRIKYLEGLSEPQGYNSSLVFGELWHLCEECLAAGKSYASELSRQGREYLRKYPDQQTEIHRWLRIIKRQFPTYVAYWKQHPDVQSRVPIYQEKSFSVPHAHGLGLTTLLRGKWDSVDLIKTDEGEGVYIQENKTKTTVDEQFQADTLVGHLQTIVYQTALREHAREVGVFGGISSRKNQAVTSKIFQEYPILGTRQNIVIRPFRKFGKYAIKQRKGRRTKQGLKGAETDGQFLNRMAQLIKDNPGDFFIRYRMDISQAVLEDLQRRILDPILSQIHIWYEWASHAHKMWLNPFDQQAQQDIVGAVVHYQTPWGLYHPLHGALSPDGNQGSHYEYLTRGRVKPYGSTTLFPEL